MKKTMYILTPVYSDSSTLIIKTWEHKTVSAFFDSEYGLEEVEEFYGAEDLQKAIDNNSWEEMIQAHLEHLDYSDCTEETV